MPQTPLSESLLRKIRAKGRGSVFTPSDFLQIGSRSAIDKILSRLARRGILRRITRGVYDYPRTNPTLGITVYPSIHDIALAVAKSHGARVQVSGAYAANVLGLSTQVPARVVYLTDGYSKTISLGKQTLVLRRASPRVMKISGRISGTVIQALKYLGHEGVTPEVIKKLHKLLPPEAKPLLLKDQQYAPAWIREIIAKVLLLRKGQHG